MNTGRQGGQPGQQEIAPLRARMAQEFGALPVPRELALLKEMAQPGHAADLPVAHRLRRGLAGRHWQSLTREEAKAWWSAFCHLSPAGYRYYLPALLDQALAGFEHDPAFADTVGCALNASCWQIYYHGRDDDMARRQDLFNSTQYEAVVLFLDLLRRHGRQPHRAAMALKYAWNRHPELPAHQDTLHWYAQQTHWHCPAATGAAQPVVEQIEAAFSDSVCPPLQALCGCGLGDEPAALALELSGLAWQAITPAFLDLNSAALKHLSPEGLAYFMAAWMRADTLGLLNSDEPASRLARTPLEPLTARQRAALASYLEFTRRRARDIDEALAPTPTPTQMQAQYWTQETAA